jgi:eukaryotic-like serine/threonine-protein kinase
MELIGQRFGHIRVTEVVGQGGMGDVYAGYDEKLERKVAIKVLNADQRPDADARERLLREARALSKLDHPNICRIHDYLEHADVDVLVLEYIDGTTLEDVSPESFSRSEKLRIASAIASVLVAAHRAGIVHRDLKPENVMITRSGEVKVLDFGLARWLNRVRGTGLGASSDKYPKVVPLLHVRSSSETLPLPSEYDSAAPRGTAVGVTLGTPLYMSPEQARGDALTPASDMYSFGLVLQKLFSGTDPHPSELAARDIILRVARGETNPVTGVPHDVAHLIGRLKQFAPADRLTAVEALDRLRYMSARPQRVLQGAVAAVVLLLLAIGGWRYTADLKYERAQAELARAEAERRRNAAEDLINFMVGGLRTKLDPVGNLDVLDDVAKKTLQYIRDVEPARMSTAELVRNARVLHQLGDVQISRGDPPAALTLFRDSLKLAETARKRDPQNADVQLAYAQSRFWIGDVYRREKQYPQALDAMREYLNITEQLAKQNPQRQDLQTERTYGHTGVGMILEAQGNIREALAHYEVSLRVRQAQVRQKPDDAALLADLAPVYNKIGLIQQKLGNLSEARDYFRRELETYRMLIAADPKHTQRQRNMAISLTFLALTHWYMGDVDGAHALWREELAIEQALAKRDPENVDWQRNVVATTRRLANVAEARGETSQAAATLAQAQSRLRELLKQAPRSKALEAYRNAVDIDLARVLAANGSTGRAKALLDETIARVETSSDRASQIMLARATNTLGEIIRESDPPRAEAAWRRAEQLLEPHVQSTSDVLERDLWCRVLVHRGRCDDARREHARLRLARYDTRGVDKVLSLGGCK